MAWGRKKSGGRKEPLFGLLCSARRPAPLSDDRIPAAVDDDKPKKQVPRRKDEDDDVVLSAAARAQAARAKRRRQAACKIARAGSGSAGWSTGARCSACGRRSPSSASWSGSARICLAIQSLEIPKWPPTIQIVGVDGSLLASRGEMAGTNVALKDLPPYVPNAVIAIEDRRFRSHFGVDPGRHARRGGERFAAAWCRAARR